MSARHGSKAITDVRYGSKQITQIRRGSTLLWSRANLRDDFNRDDSIGLGPNWVDLGPATDPYLASVTNGYARLNIPEGLINLSLRTSRMRFNGGVKPTDAGHIEARVAIKGDEGWDRITEVYGWMNADMSGGVAIRLDGARASIVRRVNNVNTVVAAGGPYAAGDSLRLIRSADLITWTLRRNGQLLAEWADPTMTVTTGVAFRSLGLLVSGTKDTFGPRRYSAAIDYIEAA
ncbi:virion structural protein [Gordonia phage Sour]|uniref:Minor tail protein n=1 Tax=Gordonia phage Sour TaxID=2182349 RepID=A0A2U8UL85_9CAUD|nr:virion structural protein [Gordonia phage Sour]AWN04241.1 minor tail protein [Gordonia phage Sour]